MGTKTVSITESFDFFENSRFITTEKCDARITARHEVEDTRLEAKDTKKKSVAKTKDQLLEDRPSRGIGP